MTDFESLCDYEPSDLDREFFHPISTSYSIKERIIRIRRGTEDLPTSYSNKDGLNRVRGEPDTDLGSAKLALLNGLAPQRETQGADAPKEGLAAQQEGAEAPVEITGYARASAPNTHPTR